jgi:hypothetical protein
LHEIRVRVKIFIGLDMSHNGGTYYCRAKLDVRLRVTYVRANRDGRIIWSKVSLVCSVRKQGNEVVTEVVNVLHCLIYFGIV